MAFPQSYPLDPAANAKAVDEVLAQLRRRMLAGGRWTAEFRQDPPDETGLGRVRTLRCWIEIDEPVADVPIVLGLPPELIGSPDGANYAAAVVAQPPSTRRRVYEVGGPVVEVAEHDPPRPYVAPPEPAR